MKINPELKIDLILLRKQRNKMAAWAKNAHFIGAVNLLDELIDACLDKVEALVRVYDIGEDQHDRYTAVYTTPQGSHRRQWYNYLGMSDNPSHPQGVGMHGEFDEREMSELLDGDELLGIKIDFTDLPEACQVAVLNDLEEELNDA